MAMTLVSTVTVGSGGAASIEFTSIPQTGKDLLILLSGRNETAAGLLRANNVSASSSYSGRRLLGDGSATSSAADTAGTTRISFGITNYTAFTANTFSSHSIYISNYTSTTAHKSVSADSVTENNATESYQNIVAAIIKDNNPITSLQIIEQSTYVYAQYTTASLYIIS